jgi:hypothetical protein
VKRDFWQRTGVVNDNQLGDGQRGLHTYWELTVVEGQRDCA